jgi:hypothetical protein
MKQARKPQSWLNNVFFLSISKSICAPLSFCPFAATYRQALSSDSMPLIPKPFLSVPPASDKPHQRRFLPIFY